MCQESFRKEKGFTLIEVTVSLMILIVVLVLSTTLLFTMQGFAKRQRQFAEPRQTARRAIDYVGSYLRGATDGNFERGNPNAIVVWYRINNVPTQATYNNVNDPNLAEPGTDIITFGRSEGGGNIIISKWSGGGDFSNASSVNVHFRDGCPDMTVGGNAQLNMLKFMQVTGCTGDPSCYTGNFPCPGCTSKILTVVDPEGNYAYFQITGYQGSDCAPAQQWQEISLTANPGGNSINPPGDRNVSCAQQLTSLTAPSCKIGKNVNYMAFRVKRDATGIPQLQQKEGFFNPNTDNGGANDTFIPLLDNIEDLQIAYIYNDGQIRNDGIFNLIDEGYPGGVPSQANSQAVVPARDITNVVGIRVSITARANTEVSLVEKAKFRMPQSEDRAQGPEDRFFHYRLTSTVMLRNRNLGG